MRTDGKTDGLDDANSRFLGILRKSLMECLNIFVKMFQLKILRCLTTFIGLFYVLILTVVRYLDLPVGFDCLLQKMHILCHYYFFLMTPLR
jgi:hypothetical protein